MRHSTGYLLEMLYYLSLVSLAGVFLSVLVYDDAAAIALGKGRLPQLH